MRKRARHGRHRAPADLRLDRDGRGVRADGPDPLARSSEHVPLTVELPGQAGARADGDEREFAVAGRHRVEREHEPGASPHLVHLVAMDRHQLQHALAMIEAERAVLVANPGPSGARGSPILGNHPRRSYGSRASTSDVAAAPEQERPEPVRRCARRDPQQFGVVPQHGELRRRKPPRVRSPVRGPRGRDSRGLAGDEVGIGREARPRAHAPIMTYACRRARAVSGAVAPRERAGTPGVDVVADGIRTP